MKTPRTDAAAFSATTERPSDGDYELEVVDAGFARGLELRIANLEAGSIHSCHDQCQRTECVLRRRVAELEKERDEYKYVAATLDDLYVAGQHRIAELEKDKERIDWFNDQGKPETFDDAPHSLVWVIIGDLGQSNLRDAIDAARNKS